MSTFNPSVLDSRVIEFIDNFLSYEGEDHKEIIRHLFHARYCYYFALMLKDAFHRGQLCLAYPFGHIVWLDGSDENDDIAYDIEGVCTNYEHLIPISYLGETIQDFKHVPGENCYADAAECKKIYSRFLQDQVSTFNTNVERDSMITALGVYLRKLRIDRDEKLKDMASRLQVSSAYLSAVETGKRNAPFHWISTISNLYNLDDSEKEALLVARMKSFAKIQIDLSEASIYQREVAANFALSLHTLDDDKLDAIMKILS